MSPRLLFLLTFVHAHHPLDRERDRIDARLAATRLSTPVRREATTYVLLEAA